MRLLLCKRNQRKFFSIWFRIGILLRDASGNVDWDSNNIAGHPGDVKYSGDGIENLLESQQAKNNKNDNKTSEERIQALDNKLQNSKMSFGDEKIEEMIYFWLY